jgi:hypothetical protein
MGTEGLSGRVPPNGRKPLMLRASDPVGGRLGRQGFPITTSRALPDLPVGQAVLPSEGELLGSWHSIPTAVEPSPPAWGPVGRVEPGHSAEHVQRWLAPKGLLI